MKKIKLWISDIDGTLLNYDSSYTELLEKTLSDVQNAGVKVVLATGRMYDGAKFVADKFNIKTPVVCYQGAVVRLDDKVLWDRCVNNNLVLDIINYLREYKIHTHIYNNDVLYVEDDNKKIMSAYCDGRGTVYSVVSSFDEINLNSVPKVLAVIEDKTLMQKVKKELSEKYKNELTIVQSSPIYLEINDKNASKGEALKFLKGYWNLSDDEVLASGDQDNDVEMLKHAGIRVCVGVHSEELLRIADYHCKDVNSDELLKLVRKFVL